MRRDNPYVGRTVALTRCPAMIEVKDGWVEGEISGLWTIWDYEPADLRTGVLNDCFDLSREEEHPTDERYAPGWNDGPLGVHFGHVNATVYPPDLIEQVNPGEHMKMLQQEREMDWMGEVEADNEKFNMRDPVFGYPISGVRLTERTKV